MRIALFVKTCLIVAAIVAAGCSRQSEVADADCRINDGPCEKEISSGGIKAVFDIQPKPVKAMSGLDFSLALSRGDAPLIEADVKLELAMPGMHMAENRIVLRHKGNGRYEGRGVVVRCPSGRRIWKARAVISERRARKEEAVTADYTFEVGK